MKIGSLEKSKMLGNLKNKIFISFLLTLFIFISCNTSEQSEVFSFTGTTMGTTYSVKIVESSNNPILTDIQIKIDLKIMGNTK